MTFGEKLASLTANQNRAELSRRAGLPPNAISDYINKDYLPRVDTAAALARALNVSLDWLADDRAEAIPPERTESEKLGRIGDTQLMNEVARRWVSACEDLKSSLEVAEKLNWKLIRARLPKGDDEAPPEVLAAANVLRQIESSALRATIVLDTRYHLNLLAHQLDEENPIPHLDSLRSRADALRKNPDAGEVLDRTNDDKSALRRFALEAREVLGRKKRKT